MKNKKKERDIDPEARKIIKKSIKKNKELLKELAKY